MKGGLRGLLPLAKRGGQKKQGRLVRNDETTMQTTQRSEAVRQKRSRMPTIPRIGIKPSTVTERSD